MLSKNIFTSADREFNNAVYMNCIAVGISQLIQTVHESFTEMYNSFIMAPKFSLQSTFMSDLFSFQLDECN